MLSTVMQLFKGSWFFKCGCAGSRHLWPNLAIANGTTYVNYVSPTSKWSMMTEKNIVTATVAWREKVPQYARVLATLGFSLNFILAVWIEKLSLSLNWQGSYFKRVVIKFAPVTQSTPDNSNLIFQRKWKTVLVIRSLKQITRSKVNRIGEKCKCHVPYWGKSQILILSKS